MGQYDTAQICLNGHVITSMGGSSPEFRKDYCDECGEKTIMSCPDCNNPIKGYYDDQDIFGGFHYDRPKFCDSCGHPYPWTTQQTNAAKELVDFTDNLTKEEKEDLKKSIDDIIKDNANTTVAQVKLKKYASKAGTEVAKGIKDILIGIVSETVKKAIWGT